MSVSGFSEAGLSPRARALRRQLLGLVRSQGLRIDRNYLVDQRDHSKEEVRQIHSLSKAERLAEERPFAETWFPRLQNYFASGTEVDPRRIDPCPIVVDGEGEMASLFRLASLWWSVPVSRGFGRRFRILVLDASNGKLMGLLGMTDPVFNLRVRDNCIGWSTEQREKRLAHVMDAYVLGAVPPYNRLLGAKFVALLAASDFVRDVFRRRYCAERSVILGRKFDGRLAMITATSALGPSSIYNRLRVDGSDVYRPVGFTEGYGHFHLANGTYQRLREYLGSLGDKEIDKYKFGNGPNYRIRVVRRALEHLKLPGDLLRHGVRRAVYVAQMAHNSAAFLRGEHERLRWCGRSLEEVTEYWRNRWLLPRSTRDLSYQTFDKGEWRAFTGLASS